MLKKKKFWTRKSFPVWMTILSFLMFFQWCFKPLNILYLKIFNPGSTSFMNIREREARRKKASYNLQYHFVPLNKISGTMQKVVLTTEDYTFYQHSGVEWPALFSSLKINLQSKGYVKGGSTITQQLAKNLFLSPSKSLWRKFREIVIALELEGMLNKKRILELYLNVAEWGRGVFGSEAAARLYFHKPASEINLSEAVALAAVLPSPIRHSPVRQDRFLKWRLNWVWSQIILSENTPAPPQQALASQPETDYKKESEEITAEEDSLAEQDTQDNEVSPAETDNKNSTTINSGQNDQDSDIQNQQEKQVPDPSDHTEDQPDNALNSDQADTAQK